MSDTRTNDSSDCKASLSKLYCSEGEPLDRSLMTNPDNLTIDYESQITVLPDRAAVGQL